MQYDAATVDEYIANLPDDRKNVVRKLHDVILANLPKGFEEYISYGMISYVVPLSRYPKGYHTKKNEPLPFMGLASQKNHIAVYHMGMYGDKTLEEWFIKEYANRATKSLDMGKSCIRFRNPADIPYELIGELCTRITVDDYIKAYEAR